MTDDAESAGLKVPHLSDETIRALNEFVPVHGQSVKNPLDIFSVLVNPEHVDGDEPDGSWTVTAPGTDRMWQSIVMSALIVSSLAISLGVNLKRRSADSSERDFEVFFRIRGRRSD